MNKPSRTYYLLSALIGIALGVFVLGAQVQAWSNFFLGGELIFVLEKYNFECVSSCAITAHLGYILFGCCSLFLGVHAVVKLIKYKDE